MDIKRLKRYAQQYEDLSQAEVIGLINSLWGANVASKQNQTSQTTSAYKMTPRSSRTIARLDTRFQPLVKQFLRAAYDAGIPIELVSGYRSFAEQDKLYEQGRTKPGMVVTNANAGGSMHNYGLAVDVAPLNEKGKIYWPQGQKANEIYNKLAEIGKGIGMKWGGDWKGFKDMPHFQHPTSIREIATGKFKPEISQ